MVLRLNHFRFTAGQEIIPICFQEMDHKFLLKIKTHYFFRKKGAKLESKMNQTVVKLSSARVVLIQMIHKNGVLNVVVEG